MNDVDQLDLDIMRILQQDGHMPLKDIGIILDKPESTVRSRYNSLCKRKILQVVAIANPPGTGLNIMCLLYLKVELQHIEEAAKQIGKLSEVRFIAYTSGVYDLIIEIFVKGNDQIVHFMTKKLSKVIGIKEYDLSLELKLYKNSFQWLDRNDLLNSSH